VTAAAARRWRLWLVGVALSVGCAAAEPAPPPPPAVVYPSVDTTWPGAKLVIGSPDLLGRVIATSPQFRKQGRLTEAVVTVQNLSSGTFVLEYLFEWEDDSGFTVDEVKVWQHFTLTPHQVMKFTSTGPAPEATRITFTIRYPERKL
jgi:uncharacterized protein YcfL